MKHGWVIWVGGTVAVIAGSIALLECRDRAARKPFLADEYVAEAVARAHEHAADATITKIEATFVDPDGRVHTEHGGELRVTLRAPSQRGGDQPAVLGAPHAGGGSGCLEMDEDVDLYIDEGASLEHRFDTREENGACAAAVTGPLHCTIAEIWARAIANGAPHPALASITLSTETGGAPVRTWSFAIIDRRTDGPDVPVFDKTFPDACR
jgi:hypothetical protein